MDGWNPAKAGATGNSNFDVWATFTSGGSLITRQIQGDGIDQHLAYVTSSNAYWYLTDHLGSTRATINNSGTVQDSLVYDAYGNITSQSNASAAPLYTYTGRELDVETGLQYNRARWYDPGTGRWITQDPLGFDAGDSNLYRYANNHPMARTDPSGLQVLGGPPGGAKDGAGTVPPGSVLDPGVGGTAKGGEPPMGIVVKPGVGVGVTKGPLLIELLSPLKGYNKEYGGMSQAWMIPLAFKLTGAASKQAGGAIIAHATGNTFRVTYKDGTTKDLTQTYYTDYWMIVARVPGGKAEPNHVVSGPAQALFGVPAGTKLDYVYQWPQNAGEAGLSISMSLEVYYINGITRANDLFRNVKANNLTNFKKLALTEPGLRVRPSDVPNEFKLEKFSEKGFVVSPPLNLNIRVTWKLGKDPEFGFPQ